MLYERPVRILVVAEGSAINRELIEAIEGRAARGRVQFRLVVPNPAAAELHLNHPQRHDKAAEAESALREVLPAIEAAAGSPVVGSVSVRHDPMDVVEDVLYSEPIDEIMLAVTTHHFADWLHQDLEHRLRHYHLPVTSVRSAAVRRTSGGS